MINSCLFADVMALANRLDYVNDSVNQISNANDSFELRKAIHDTLSCMKTETIESIFQYNKISDFHRSVCIMLANRNENGTVVLI
jgi:hypothetical protein